MSQVTSPYIAVKIFTNLELFFNPPNPTPNKLMIFSNKILAKEPD